ncbi:MAG TPA: glycine cleavage system protein GcvH [Rhodobacteraceae bacterium]|nr:glycine cleavage system protein GcvH [Paracoccaceae bacterium]
MTIYYTEEHEWLEVEGDTATLGITKHAAEALGEVVFVELQEAGETYDKDDEIGVVESVKAASELYAPLAMEVLEANSALEDNPGMVNEDPEGNAWFYKIKISDTAELENLLDVNAYKALID